MCATTDTRQGRRSAKEQSIAPGRTESDKACGLSDMVHLHEPAIVYLNGDSIQETFDFSLQELKERLRKRIDEVDATSHMPLTKAVLWTTEPAVWHSAAEAVQAT
ncbi:TPA: hypothetical protein ACH3X1_011955 [Trebouxia sp. C0004]